MAITIRRATRYTANIAESQIKLGAEMIPQAKELRIQAHRLAAEQRYAEAVEYFDQAISAPQATIAEVATSMKDKGVTLGLAGESHQAYEVLSEVIVLFREETNEDVILAVGKSYYNMASLLAGWNRYEEAAVYLDQVFSRCAFIDDPQIQRLVAESSLYSANIRNRVLGQVEIALDGYRSIIHINRDATDHRTLLCVAQASASLALNTFLASGQGAAPPEVIREVLSNLDFAVQLLRGFEEDSSIDLLAKVVLIKSQIFGVIGQEEEKRNVIDRRYLEHTFGVQKGEHVKHWIDMNESILVLGNHVFRAKNEA